LSHSSLKGQAQPGWKGTLLLGEASHAGLLVCLFVIKEIEMTFDRTGTRLSCGSSISKFDNVHRSDCRWRRAASPGSGTNNRMTVLAGRLNEIGP
jgi:hypothetical protein